MTVKLKGSSDGSVSLSAPADTSPSGTDITLTLPTDAGSANQFLKNSGTAGTLDYSSMVEDSSNRLLLGTSSAFDGGTSTLLQISSTGGARFALARNDTTTAANDSIGRIRWYGNDSDGNYDECARIEVIAGADHASTSKPSAFTFHTTAASAESSSERLRILSDGTIATGGLTATPGTVAAGSYIQNAANAGFFGNNGDAKFGSSANNPVIFQVNGSEKARIDTAGQVGIGNADPGTLLHVSNSSDDGAVRVGGNNGGGTGFTLSYSNSGNTTTTIMQNYRQTNANALIDIDTGTFTVSTGTGGTERLRVTSAGAFKSSTDGTYQNVSSTSHEFCQSNASVYALRVEHSGTTPSGILIDYSGVTQNDTGSSFIQGEDATTFRFRFASNGGLYNYSGNNSNLCDEREKKNIEALDSTWGCLKNWELKKFHYNEDADTDDKRYGVIAQQVEQHCPELISDWIKQSAAEAVLDDDGNVVTPAKEEILRKGVKEQQMLWMAIKALQEAQTRIEALETKVAALEAA